MKNCSATYHDVCTVIEHDESLNENSLRAGLVQYLMAAKQVLFLTGLIPPPIIRTESDGHSLYAFIGGKEWALKLAS